MRELATHYDSRKSFYGKATVDFEPVEGGGVEVLRSYGSRVAERSEEGIRLIGPWDYSATTLRHVREFVAQATGRVLSKAELAREYA